MRARVAKTNSGRAHYAIEDTASHIHQVRCAKTKVWSLQPLSAAACAMRSVSLPNNDPKTV